MQFVNPIPLLLLFISLVAAKAHHVNVGKGGLKFEPDTIQAEPGDKVHFHFYPSHHGVAESSYDSPCKPIKHSMWSGYFDNLMKVDKEMWTITIKDKDPHWLYCPTTTHCQTGMSMVINPPRDEQTLKSYKSRSLTVLMPKAPKKVRGGVFSPNKGGGGS